MASSYNSLRLKHQRAMDTRLTADHAAMARSIAMLVVRAAGLDGLVPNTRSARETLRTAIWEDVVKKYYIGAGNEPLDGPRPQSPYALLLVEGITQATRIQAERQAAIVRRVVKDPVVLAWLTGPRPFEPVREMQPVISGRITELTLSPTAATMASLRGADGRIDVGRARAAFVRPRGMYEPFHQWVDPNGYRLSDRVWRTSIDVRSRIDRLMEYHISRGTSAVEIANLVEPFLTPTALRQRTRTPYGSEGSYSARRLARSEITAAAGRATINASTANPFVNHMQWRLSGSHPKIDHCDDNASGGPNGDGIYPLGEVPRYPDHPHCLCSLLPVPSGNTAELVESLRADIQAARQGLLDSVGGRSANALRGILNPDYLTRALMNGNLDEAVATAVQRARSAPIARLPRKVAAKPVTAVAPTVPKFKTIGEAEQWIKENVANRVNFPSSASLDGVREIAESVAEISERFGLPKMEYIGSYAGSGRRFKETEGAIAAAWRDNVTKSNYLFGTKTDPQEIKALFDESNRIAAERTPMPALLKKIEVKIKADAFDAGILPIAQSRQSSQWVVGGTLKDSYNHEMGHILSFAHPDRQALNRIAKNARKRGWGNVLSEYGNTNDDEFVAESFSAYMKGNRSNLNPEILDWFVKHDGGEQ